jgi:hypothetical protein
MARVEPEQRGRRMARWQVDWPGVPPVLLPRLEDVHCSLQSAVQQRDVHVKGGREGEEDVIKWICRSR